MKKIKLLIIIIVVTMMGCASSFTPQYRVLNEQYRAGNMTYDQYLVRYQIIQNEEIRRQQQVQWLLR